MEVVLVLLPFVLVVVLAYMAGRVDQKIASQEKQLMATLDDCIARARDTNRIFDEMKQLRERHDN